MRSGLGTQLAALGRLFQLAMHAAPLPRLGLSSWLGCSKGGYFDGEKGSRANRGRYTRANVEKRSRR